MKYLEILRAKLAELTTTRDAAIAEAEAIADLIGDETDTEKRDAAIADGDAALERAKTLTDEIKLVEERIGELEAIVERAHNAKDVPFSVVTTPDDPYNVDLRAAPRNEATVRDINERAFRAVAEERGLGDDRKGRAEELLRDQRTNRGGALARHIIATGRPEYRSAWGKLVTSPQPLLSAEELRAVEEVRALQITADSSGGYLMPFTLDPTIILTNNGAVNPIREVATVRTVATDNWQGVSSAGVTASYASESTEVGDGTPTLAQPNVQIEQAHAFVPFTVQAEDDLANLAEDVAVMFGDAKSRLEALKFTSGTGTNEPAGLIAAGVAFDSGSSVVNTAGSGAFVIGDVFSLQEALPARWDANGVWMMNKKVVNKIRQFGTANNYFAFMTDLKGDGRDPILGDQVYRNSEMDSDVTTAGKKIAVYGDIGAAYLILDRIGLSIELVPHLFGASGRPTGQRGWYARWRNGANVVNGSAIRILNVKS